MKMAHAILPDEPAFLGQCFSYNQSYVLYFYTYEGDYILNMILYYSILL